MKKIFFSILTLLTGLLVVLSDWASLSLPSIFLGIFVMMLNFWVWYLLYQKMTQSTSDQMIFWVSLMGLKFLILGVCIFALPKLLAVDILSLGAGIFIVAISGICASVGLAKSQGGDRTKNITNEG